MKEIANKARLEAEKALLEEVSKISTSGYDINDLAEPRRPYPKRAKLSGYDTSSGVSIFPDRNITNPFDLVQGGPAGRRRNLSGYAPSLYGGPAVASDAGVRRDQPQTRESSRVNDAILQGAISARGGNEPGTSGYFAQIAKSEKYSAEEVIKARKIYIEALKKTGNAEKALNAATLIIAKDRRLAGPGPGRFAGLGKRVGGALSFDVTGGLGARYGSQAGLLAAFSAIGAGSSYQANARPGTTNIGNLSDATYGIGPNVDFAYNQASIGGGIAGAGAGALAGAQFGPAGAIIGAFVGGLSSANDAFYDFNQSHALKELEDATKGASKALEAFERTGDASGLNAAFGNVERRRGDLQRAKIDSQGNSSESIFGEFLNNINDASRFTDPVGLLTGAKISDRFQGVRKLAFGADSVNEADAKAKNDQTAIERNRILEAFREDADAAELRAQKARSLNSRGKFGEQSAVNQTLDFQAIGLTDALFKSQAEQRIKGGSSQTNELKLATERGREILAEEKRVADERKAIEESFAESVKNSRIGVESLAETLDRFGAQLQTLGKEFDAAAVQSSSLVDQLHGGLGLSRSYRNNPFDNLKAASEGDLRGAAGAIGAGSNSSLVEGALSLQRLEEEIPKFVRSLKESDIQGDNVQSRFKGFLKDSFPNLPKEVAENFIANFNNKIRKTEGGESNLKELQREGNIVKAIGGTDVLESQVKVLSDLFKKRADAESAYIDEINKIAQVRQIIEERQSKLEAAQVQTKRVKASETGDIPSLGDLEAPRRARLARLTSGLSGPTNAAGVRDAISSAQNRLKELAAKPVQSSEDIRERANLSAKIKDLTSALELVADSSDSLANINEKLEESQNKREEKRGLARELFSNGAAGRFDIARNVGALKTFLNADVTGKGGKVDPRKQAGLARFLDVNYDRVEAGLEFVKRNKELVKANGLNPDDIIRKFEEQLEKTGAPGLGFKAAREEEDALKAERAAVLKAQEEAAAALRDVATVSLPDMINNANNAFIAFEKFVKEYLGSIDPKRKAIGGYISGPGTGRSDSIPAMLSNGEYVVRADAVRRIGRGNLDKINSGKIPRFASGGLVGVGSGSRTLSVDTTAIQNVVLKLSEAVNKLASVNIPSEITMTGNHKLEVVINGAEVLRNLMSGPLAEFVKAEIEKTVKKYIPLDQRIGK